MWELLKIPLILKEILMKKNTINNMIGITVISFMMISCVIIPDSERTDMENNLSPIINSLEGHWFAGSIAYIFTDNNFEYSNGVSIGYTGIRGTFTYTENQIVFQSTHAKHVSRDGIRWESISDVDPRNFSLIGPILNNPVASYNFTYTGTIVRLNINGVVYTKM